MGKNDSQAETYLHLVQPVIRTAWSLRRECFCGSPGGGELRCRCMLHGQECINGGGMSHELSFYHLQWLQGAVRGYYSQRSIRVHAALPVLSAVQAGFGRCLRKGNRKAALAER